MRQEDKNEYAGAVVGGVGGGVLGYYIGEQIGNHKRTYSMRERAVSTLIGAGMGALSGKGIAKYLNSNMSIEKKLKDLEED